jgi:uncharacterized protein involved in cysteine biosynthesis
VSSRRAPRPTAITGFVQVFEAISFVWRTPVTWPLVLVPAVLFTLLASAATIAGVLWITPYTLSLLPTAESFWLTAAEWATRILSYLLSVLLGVWVALVLTPPLSGPALESLVGHQERALQLPDRAPSGFWAELWVGFRAQALALGFALPALVLLTLAEVFVPGAAIVATPLKALVTATALAWNLFDYPLTLRGVPASERLGFVASNLGPVLGFGVGFSALFWVPCLGILMLPIGVVAATRLVHLLLAHDPEQLASVPRALPSRAPEPLGPASREVPVARDNRGSR